MSRFRKLLVYEKAEPVALDVVRVVRRWDSFDRWTTGVQIVRAADGICANLAEGTGRWGHPDQRRFYVMARGSACELQCWLRLAGQRDLPVPERAAERAEELVRMLNGLIRSTKH